MNPQTAVTRVVMTGRRAADYRYRRRRHPLLRVQVENARKLLVKKSSVLIARGWALILGVWLLPVCHQVAVAASPATPNMDTVVDLPDSAWASLQKAQGIVTGGPSGAPVRVQVIFDPDCPYCALLYRYFQKRHPDTAVRWVPVAYLLPDSGTRAAAILASPNPAVSLDTDLFHYNFNGKASHGGYGIPTGEHKKLHEPNVELKQYWEQWGGVTPMIFVRKNDGILVRILGYHTDIIDDLLERTPPRLRSYQK